MSRPKPELDGIRSSNPTNTYMRQSLNKHARKIVTLADTSTIEWSCTDQKRWARRCHPYCGMALLNHCGLS